MAAKDDRIRYQDGTIIGNLEDKANTSNPIAKAMVAGFDRSLEGLLDNSKPQNIHEVGCGEGRLSEAMQARFSCPVRGTELSHELVTALQAKNLPGVTIVEKNIYNLDPAEDAADVIVCCEVLEHVPDYERAIKALKSLSARQYVLSVPREPLWCALNMARGKYWSALGNTPGHLNHWSAFTFQRFLKSHGFVIEEIKRPLPWTMVRGYFKA